jgi:hypothetical protein
MRMRAVYVSEKMATGAGELSRYSDERIRVGFPAGETYSSYVHNVQTGSRAYEALYPVDTRDKFPRVEQLGRETSHSP